MSGLYWLYRYSTQRSWSTHCATVGGSRNMHGSQRKWTSTTMSTMNSTGYELIAILYVQQKQKIIVVVALDDVLAVTFFIQYETRFLLRNFHDNFDNTDAKRVCVLIYSPVKNAEGQSQNLVYFCMFFFLNYVYF